MAPQVALVTGGNTGIGWETCKTLAEKGFKVILASRDNARGEAAISKIKEVVSTANIEMLQLDLGDLASVRSAASTVAAKYAPLELLINNAGVMACPKGQTKDGFETQIGVNHLGHFLFTLLLLPSIKPQGDRCARIINLSSSAHKMGSIDLKDLNYNTREYKPWAAYGQSKLANILFTNELVNRLPSTKKIKVFSVHPGVVHTELGRHLEQRMYKPVAYVAKLIVPRFMKTPTQGAATSLHCALSPDVEHLNGKYFADCKALEPNDEAKDAEMAKGLWELSVKLTNPGDVDALLGV